MPHYLSPVLCELQKNRTMPFHNCIPSLSTVPGVNTWMDGWMGEQINNRLTREKVMAASLCNVIFEAKEVGEISEEMPKRTENRKKKKVRTSF